MAMSIGICPRRTRPTVGKLTCVTPASRSDRPRGLQRELDELRAEEEILKAVLRVARADRAELDALDDKPLDLDARIGELRGDDR
jgi:hypothetical protein